MPNAELLASAPALRMHVHQQRIVATWVFHVKKANEFQVDLTRTSIGSDLNLALRTSEVQLFDVERNQSLFQVRFPDTIPATMNLPQGTVVVMLTFSADYRLTNAVYRTDLVLRNGDNYMSAKWDCEK